MALLQEYTNAPLLLSIQWMRHKDYNTAHGNQIEFGVTSQPTLKRSNIGITLFRDDPIRSRQRFVNPCIQWQMAIGGLANPIPSTKYSTIKDPRFVHLLLDACNVNNSKTVCIPNDVHSSIHRYTDY